MENRTEKGQFKKGMIPWNKKELPCCSVCGKKSKWIKVSGKCNKCWLKSWSDIKNHPRYIVDRTLLKDDYHDRGGQLHREWSRSVKNRDGWKCKIANGDCSGQVVAHHILSWRDYQELRYEVNNGITLCQFHHPRKRNDEIRLSPYFQGLIIAN